LAFLLLYFYYYLNQLIILISSQILFSLRLISSLILSYFLIIYSKVMVYKLTAILFYLSIKDQKIKNLFMNLQLSLDLDSLVYSSHSLILKVNFIESFDKH